MTSPMTLNQHKKIDHYVIFASLKNQLGNVKTRIPCSPFLISSLPGLASRTNVESLGKPRDVNKRSRSLI